MTTINLQVGASTDDADEDGAGFIQLTRSTVKLTASTERGGVRFQNVTIPAGATINSADLQIKAPNTSNDDPDDLIRAELGSAAAFSSTNSDITNRTLTTASTTWTATAIGTGWVSAPDLSDEVQEVVNGTWSSGDDLAIIFYHQSAAAFRITAYDSDPASAATLDIDYTAPAAGGASPTVSASPFFSPSGQATYSIWLKNSNMQPLAVLADFISLEYVRSVNNIGSCKLVIEDTLPENYIQEDGVIEIWRKLPGSRAYVDAETVYRIRKVRKNILPGGNVVEVVGLDTMELLNRPLLAYRSGTTYTDKSGIASTVMKAIVDENATVAGGTSDRLVTGGFASTYFRVQADPAVGQSVKPKNLAYKTVLSALKGIANQSAELGTSVFFDVVRIDDNLLECRFYADHRGVNLGPASGNEVVLSPEWGTLDEAVFEMDYTSKATVVLVTGAGQQENRLVGTATDSLGVAVSPFAQIETVFDARNIEDQTTLNNLAEQGLENRKETLIVSGKLIDTDGLRYGLHYNYGDRLSIQIDGQVFAARIDGVQVKVEGGKETIQTALSIEV